MEVLLYRTEEGTSTSFYSVLWLLCLVAEDFSDCLVGGFLSFKEVISVFEGNEISCFGEGLNAFTAGRDKRWMGTGSVWKKEEENLIAVFMTMFNSAIFVKIEKGGDVIVAVRVFFGTVSAEEI